MKKLIQKIKDGTVLQILQELRWIGGYGRRYVWAMCWFMLVGAVGTVLGLGASIVGKDIIDIVTGYQTGRVIWMAVVYVVMQTVQILFSAVSNRVSAKIQLRVGQELRKEIFQTILHAQWEPLSKYHSGDLLTRSSRDVDTVAGSIMSLVPSLVINLLQFAGTFAVLAWFDYTLALIALGSAPVVILLSGFLSKRVRRHSKQMRSIGSELAAFHTETFQNIQFVKSFDALGIFRDKLFQLQQKQKDATLEFNRFSILTSSGMSFMGMIVGGICFFWSVYRLWGNHITFGEMTLFLGLSGALSGSFGGLVSIAPSAITAATAAGRIMEVTRLPAEERTAEEELVRKLQKDSKAVRVQAEGLEFSYASGKQVFSNAGFCADPGEIVAFVGPSGGGKSTMLRLLLGVITAQKGSIRLWGGDPEVTVCASAATRRLFAYVPQENTLFSGTIAQNLRICAPEATDEELEEALRIACAYGFVSGLPEGIHTKVAERGGDLSEGQVQRLSIARALLSGAPILLLDEATSALDAQTEQELLQNIMRHRSGSTCIVTTHRPSVLEVCHRVYRIESQRVIPLGKEDVREFLQML